MDCYAIGADAGTTAVKAAEETLRDGFTPEADA